MTQNTEVNCLDIVEPFIEALSVHASESDVQVLGGIGSAALTLDEAEIFPEQRLVAVPETSELLQRVSQYRPDGTQRDLDVLVMTTDPKELASVEAIAEDIIGDQLLLSFFGLQTSTALRKQKRHPLQSLAKVWVGDRYVAPNFEKNGMVKALFPFEVEAPAASFQPWHLAVGDHEPMPIPSPAVTILNYMTRSVSGIRPKDAPKFAEIVTTVEKKAPELMDWIIDGPGASQLQLARALHSVREPRKDAAPLTLGEHQFYVMQDDELMEGDILTTDLPDDMRRIALNASRAKARTVHTYESHARLVTFWQQHVEAHIDSVIKNS